MYMSWQLHSHICIKLITFYVHTYDVTLLIKKLIDRFIIPVHHILIFTLLKTDLVPTKWLPVAGFLPHRIAGDPSIFTERCEGVRNQSRTERSPERIESSGSRRWMFFMITSLHKKEGFATLLVTVILLSFFSWNSHSHTENRFVFVWI